MMMDADSLQAAVNKLGLQKYKQPPLHPKKNIFKKRQKIK